MLIVLSSVNELRYLQCWAGPVILLLRWFREPEISVNQAITPVGFVKPPGHRSNDREVERDRLSLCQAYYLIMIVYNLLDCSALLY